MGVMKLTLLCACICNKSVCVTMFYCNALKHLIGSPGFTCTLMF